MQKHKSFVFELNPHPDQLEQLFRISGICRYVYNMGVELQKNRYKQGLPRLGKFDLTKQIPIWKTDSTHACLKEAPAECLQQRLLDLGKASIACAKKAKRTGKPCFVSFRKKFHSDTFRYTNPQYIRVDEFNETITLPKLGCIRYIKSRDITGKIKNATISYKDNKWWAAILTCEEIKVSPRSGSAIGIDVGLANFATCSDGTVFPKPNFTKRYAKRLKRHQQHLSKKKKNSNNWNKEKAKINKTHSKIKFARRDFLHKLSTSICKTHAIVVVEALNEMKMLQNSRYATKLHRDISDASWYEFRRQLKYKMEWSGGEYYEVNPAYTSQTCSSCGHASSGNRPSQAEFTCMACGHSENADLNAAKNILRLGQAMRTKTHESVSVNACASSAGNHLLS